jgi:hypothetical protein
MRKLERTIAIVISCGLATACLGSMASVQSNVPSARLTAEEYTSPNGEFRVRIPPLVHPGARIEEVKGQSGEMASAFADELGHVYVIQWWPAIDPSPTLESISQGYSVEPGVKENGIINSVRGRELRMAGLHAGGSPLSSQTSQNGKTVFKRSDIVEAWSIFFVKGSQFRVKAGVTVVDSASIDTLIPRAKKDLEAFLTGLVIQGQ